MGFAQRMKTSSKLTIPDGARKELKNLFHHEIATMVETHNISHSIILDIDQTPPLLVPLKGLLVNVSIVNLV